MTMVKLPVSREAWDEIALEVTRRGQADRMDHRERTID